MAVVAWLFMAACCTAVEKWFGMQCGVFVTRDVWSSTCGGGGIELRYGKRVLPAFPFARVTCFCRPLSASNNHSRNFVGVRRVKEKSLVPVFLAEFDTSLGAPTATKERA